MDDRESKLRVLYVLADYFGKDLSPEVAELYVSSLNAYSAVVFESAVKKGIQVWKFFPKIAEIAELLAPKSKAIAENEWACLVLHARKRGRSVVPMACDATLKALRAAGGYKALCDCSESELHWMQKRFEEAFEDANAVNGLLLDSKHLREGGQLGSGEEKIKNLTRDLSEAKRIQ